MINSSTAMKHVIDLSKFKKAISSLQAALTPPPANDRERDGAIQRFEFTFELCWKSSKKVLDLHGVSAQSPREVFRELAQKEWIDNPELWFQFLEARNKTSHIYEDLVANEVFNVLKEFYSQAVLLYDVLIKKSHD
jgi:nucleotidyltransferase substrate binding protein (TIGR01987 family)